MKSRDDEILRMRDYAISAGAQIIKYISDFMEEAYHCANNGNAKGVKRKLAAMRKSVDLLFIGFDQNFGGGDGKGL